MLRDYLSGIPDKRWKEPNCRGGGNHFVGLEMSPNGLLLCLRLSLEFRHRPHGVSVNLVERNGSNFAGSWVGRQYGCNVYCLHPRWHESSPNQCNLPWWATGRPDILIGTARSSKECENFIIMMQEWQPLSAYLATPSEIVPMGKDSAIWSQRFRADSAILGDIMAGMWSISIASKLDVESLKNVILEIR